MDDILYARPFSLNEGYETTWQAERPLVSSGYLVVLEAQPTLIAGRAGATRVLLADTGPVERVRPNDPEGILVGIVRGDIDVNTTLFWFGLPEFPELMTVDDVEQARQAALLAGITPLDPLRVTAALEEGGPTLDVADRAELMVAVRALAMAYASGEQ